MVLTSLSWVVGHHHTVYQSAQQPHIHTLRRSPIFLAICLLGCLAYLWSCTPNPLTRRCPPEFEAQVPRSTLASASANCKGQEGVFRLLIGEAVRVPMRPEARDWGNIPFNRCFCCSQCRKRWIVSAGLSFPSFRLYFLLIVSNAYLSYSVYLMVDYFFPVFPSLQSYC